MDDLDYTRKLCDPCDPEEITRLSNIVFKEGHLDRLDDLIVAILPLCHIVYYKYIKKLDDREYAKEDLISDAILKLYQDMKYRWDKYIHVDSYYEYYSTILRYGMISLVQDYHGYYITEEWDPEVFTPNDTCLVNAYDEVDVKILRENIQKDIEATAKRILKCRNKHTNLLLHIFETKYVDKEDIGALKSRVRIIGITVSLFSFYCDLVDYIYRLAYNYHYAELGGKVKMTERISGTISRFEDTTYQMLSESYYDSIIPEVYAEFGADVTKRFVKTFSNRTIQVPDYKNFCDTMLGGIVLHMTNGDKDELSRVSEEYNLPYRSLSRIFNKAIDFEHRQQEKQHEEK